MGSMTHFTRVGVVGRFKPLHNGAYRMLEAVCAHADEVQIGIGSANKYNIRNPFTANESADIIDAALEHQYTNYTFLPVPDFAHLPEYKDGQKWKAFVVQQFGKLDAFVTANPFVTELLKDTYTIVHPATLVPKENWVQLRATEVRIAMAGYGDWKKLVPTEVAAHMEKEGLIARFQKEFGLATLATIGDTEYRKAENTTEEWAHAQEA